MGNVAALTVAFNEPNLIKPCIRQFKKDYLGQDIFHLVLVSSHPWRGGWKADNTFQIAHQNGASMTLSGAWENQAEQFNFGLKLLKNLEYDWALIVDADEFYTPKDLRLLINEAESFRDNEISAITAPKMEVYWKLPLFRIIPKQDDNPIVAISTSKFFEDKRGATLSKYGSAATMHHFSYVRDDKEMKKKIDSFEHSDEFNKIDWYYNKWVKWGDNNNLNLHPTVPEKFERAVFDPAPKEILHNFYK